MIHFVPGSDGLITFLQSPDAGLRRELRMMDVRSGEVRSLLEPPVDDREYTLEEKLRRETMRDHFTGITSYHWATKASEATLLVPTPGGELLLQRGLDGSPRQLFEGAALDPQISKDGSTVGFVQQGEVHIVSADGGPPRQVTAGAEEGLTNGLADFLAQEELNRYSGFWLSEDGRWLVFEQVDTRHIPEYRATFVQTPSSYI